MWNSRRRTGRFVGWKISEDSRQILYIYCNLWYNITMKHTEMNETSNRELVTISRAEYEAMHAQLDAQRAELAEQNQKLDVKTAELAEQNQKLAAELAQALLQNRWLMEQLKLNKRKLFGSSSEQLDQMVMDKFAYLFNEAEAWDADSVEPAKKAEKKKPRKRRSGSIVDVIPEGTPVEVVEHPLPENERVCNICGSELVEIDVEIHRSLQVEPARFWVRENRYPTYACKHCEKETGEANVVPTPMEPTVIPGSFASPSAIAHLAVQKYVMYSPLYRLEQEFDRQGLKLSRQTMSNWLLKATEDWLQPIYDVLHQKLCKEKVLHGDETTLQVLHEKGKSATSKSYMWLYRTSETAEAPIVLYDYQPNRKAENAEQFLEGFSGWLHADGYQGYHRLPEQIRVVGCCAHARRKFDEALTAVPKEQQSASKPAEALCYFAKLFQMEQDFAPLTVEERFAKRLEQEKPVLEALLAWANALKSQTAPKSALGKALHYLLEQWPYLVRYLEDGRLEISNNRAERSIKPFVMGRKNFLFCNTPGGAQSSAVLYSLIETAKETGLDPYRYLQWVLERAPELAQKADETWAEKLIPAQAPAECRAKV